MHSLVPSLTVAIGLWFVSLLANASPSHQNITICHGFSCSIQSQISLSKSEWRSVAGWFQPEATDGATERRQIRQAIGWMEVLVGRHGPGREDRGRDLQNIERIMGQMDCIDESVNTTTYLKLFEDHGLLHWHQVVERIQRRGIVDAHWAGQIREVVTGEHYVIDSWFHDNGMLPNVQSTKEWTDIPFYTSLRDNSTD